MNGCGWTSTSVSACYNKLSCADLSDVDCQQSQFQGVCDYQAGSPSSCNVSISACTVVDSSKSECSYPNSCTFVTKAIQTCKAVSSNFKCNANTSKESCDNAYQCYWNPNSCHSIGKCENTSIDQCNTSNCISSVTECALKTSAQATCSAITTSSACISSGCEFNTDTKQCSPPQTCTVTNQACTSSVCMPSQGSCTTKASTCDYVTADGCNNNTQYCEWTDKYPVCGDDLAICQVDSSKCDSKSPFCMNVTSNQYSCTINNQQNECNGLAQDQCAASTRRYLCHFSDAKQGKCLNKYRICGLSKSESSCNEESQYCNWTTSTEYSCSTIVTPPSSSHFKIISVLSFVALAFAALF